MLDKTGQTGSPLQLVNGLILISTFAGARLVYGSIMVHTRPRLFAERFCHLTNEHHSPPFPSFPFSPCTITHQSYQFYQTLFEVRDGLSSAVLAGYACGGTLLNGLNVFW